MATPTYKWVFSPGISGFGGNWTITEAPGGVPLDQLVTKTSVDPMTGHSYLDPLHGTQIMPTSTAIVRAGSGPRNRRLLPTGGQETELSNQPGDVAPVIQRLPLDELFYRKYILGQQPLGDENA